MGEEQRREGDVNGGGDKDRWGKRDGIEDTDAEGMK